MGSSTDGSAASQDKSCCVSEDPLQPEPQGKGFFGRLLSAFTHNGEADAQPEQNAGINASMGLGALRNLSVADVAIPKAEIIAVPLDIGKDELVEVFRANGFSRLPVYKGTLDQPQGSILLKDLALHYGFGGSARFSLKRLLRPILYAPPSMPAGVLLQKMQKDRVHMALIIDEYGGVDGLITIEDLIETVIGEIDDEHDEVEGALWVEEAPGVILAQSTAPLEEVEGALGMRLRAEGDDTDIDTIGGLVFLRTGRVPGRGEIVHDETGVEIEILDADARRIKRLRLCRPGAQQPQTASAMPVTEETT